jgi:hypothetical protein
MEMHLSTQVARLATALALVAAIAAVITPDARSGHQDLGARGPSHQSEPTDMPDAVDRYLRNHTPSAVRPDDRAGVRGVGALTSGDASDVVSRYLDNNRPDVATDNAASGTSFSWRDAGVGLGGILGILLLAGAAAFAVRERRGRLTTH